MTDIYNEGTANKGENEQIKTNVLNFNSPSCDPGTNPLQTPYPGYPCINYKYYPTYMYVPGYAYPEALRLIVESVSGEREDELFYMLFITCSRKTKMVRGVSLEPDIHSDFRETTFIKAVFLYFYEITFTSLSLLQNKLIFLAPFPRPFFFFSRSGLRSRLP